MKVPNVIVNGTVDLVKQKVNVNDVTEKIKNLKLEPKTLKVISENAPIVAIYKCEIKCKTIVVKCGAFEGDEEQCPTCSVKLTLLKTLDPRKIPIIGYFTCAHCQRSWIERFYYMNDTVTCRSCRNTCLPIKMQLTPYQGKRKSYGWYKCYTCADKQWTSAYSWTNTFEECLICKTEVYPYKQFKIVGVGIKGRESHHSQHCGKCIELGYICSSRA